MVIRKCIKYRSEELGITQDELAKRLGYKSRSTINKIELGINDVSYSKLIAIAAALETNLKDLLHWTKDGEPDEIDVILLRFIPRWNEGLPKEKIQSRGNVVYAIMSYVNAKDPDNPKLIALDKKICRVVDTADKLAEIIFNSTEQNLQLFTGLGHVHPHDVREKFKNVEQLSDHIEKYWL